MTAGFQGIQTSQGGVVLFRTTLFYFVYFGKHNYGGVVVFGFIRPFERFFKSESVGGIVLFISAVIAMIWANSTYGDLYEKLFDYHFGIEFGGFHLVESLRLWVNDGLMVIFFYLVGLEIKRELTTGELNTPQKAALPVAGALGGMILPVLIYTFFNLGTPGMRGWAVPMATDIAFAMGIIRMFGSKVSRSVIVFLTALAIVDDLGAVVVIALFYTSKINFYMLAMAGGLIILLLILNIKRVSSLHVYFFLGFLLWLSLMKSGIHPTIAGVILGFLTPGKHRRAGFEPPLHRAEKMLLPWVNFLVIPVFGLANSGIKTDLNLFREVFANPMSLGIILGLFIGKQIGITLFSFIAVKLKIARLSEEATWKQVYGAAIMGGIGFTMSIFIADLSMGAGVQLSLAKLAIITGSLISAAVGAFFILAIPSGKTERDHVVQTH